MRPGGLSGGGAGYQPTAKVNRTAEFISLSNPQGRLCGCGFNEEEEELPVGGVQHGQVPRHGPLVAGWQLYLTSVGIELRES